MQNNKNKQQLLKKNKVSFNEREYKSNLNYLTAADMDMEMDEFFKELETTDEIANKKFVPKIFEVKKILLSELLSAESIRGSVSDLKSNLSKNKTLIAENNALNNDLSNINYKEEEKQAQKNFIANLLGGKKASVFANQGAINPNAILAALTRSNPNQNKIAANKASNQELKANNSNLNNNTDNKDYSNILNINRKLNPIKLTVSDDPKLKPYDMMYMKAQNFADLQVQKKKIFAMIKSFKQTVELGDLIYRLGKRFLDFAGEESSNLHAMECWDFSSKIYMRLQTEKLRLAEVYKNSSVLHLKENSNAESAMKLISNALEIFKTEIGEFSYDYAECLTNQGYILEYLDKENEAKKNFEKSLEIFKRIFINAAVEHNNSSTKDSENNENSEVNLKNELIEFKILKSQIQKEIGDCFFRLGHTHESLGNYAESVKYYKMAFTIYENFYTEGNNKFCASCLFNISNVFQLQKQYDPALEFYFKTLQIYNRIEIQFNQDNDANMKSADSLDAMVKIAKIYAETGKLDMCIDYIEKLIFEILICADAQNGEFSVSRVFEFNLSEYTREFEKKEFYRASNNNNNNNNNNQNNNNNNSNQNSKNKKNENENIIINSNSNNSERNINYNEEEADNKNFILKKFMENFESLEEAVQDYSLSIFEAMECLSDVYVVADNIFDLLLSAKVYLSIAPPVDKFINKSFDYLRIILRNTEDNLTHEELLVKIEKILDEFLKFFDVDNQTDTVAENTSSRVPTNNNLQNNTNNLYTNTHQNMHTEVTQNINNNNNNKKTEQNLITTTNNNNNNKNNNNYNNANTNANTNTNANNNNNNSAKKDEKIGEMLNEIGNESARIGLTKSAIEYFSKTISYYKKNPTSLNLYILSDIFNNLAIELDKAGDQDNCYINFIHSLKIKMEIYGPNSLKTAGAHHNIALVQDRLGRFQSAMEHWLSCTEIKKKIYGESDLQMTFCYYNIGLILQKTNDFQKALAQFDKVSEIYRNNPENEDVTYYNNIYAIAEIFYALKDFKKAVLNLNSLNKEVCTCEEKLRQVYQAQGNPQELLEDAAFQEILEIKYKCKILLGICLSFEKNYRDAAEHLRFGLNDVQLEMEDPFKYYDIALNEMAKSCEAIGEIEAAFEYYKQTIEYVKGKWSQEDVLMLQKKKDSLNVQLISRARK